jgi:hypothetical protein
LTEPPLRLVIATGPQDHREYLFASLACRYRIHLLNTAAATRETLHLLGADVVRDCAGVAGCRAELDQAQTALRLRERGSR